MVGIAIAAQAGGPQAVLFVSWVALPLTFLLIAMRPSLEGSTDSILTTGLAVWWIAVALGQAILLRNLEHGGGIVLDALLATFAMDSGAYLGGRSFGKTPLAVRISPKKTVEGLLAGAATATLAMLVASLYQEWLGVGVAVLIALFASILGPLGDLFESLLKREAGAKDMSQALGPHGGLLDRIDGVLFSVVGLYWLWLLIL
jgi:phosphatidate cytidylyltransferase